MKNCAISVIVPCYNVQDYIGETMQSLFEQTFQDFEIICIDDGSTDQTLSVLQDIASGHPNMAVIPETNHRQGYERNQGIRKAKGTYIYYLDSDDLLEKECFQVLFDCCEQDGLDILFFEADSFYESQELEEDFPQYKTLYHRKEVYPEVCVGEELYVQLRRNGDMIISPCLQMVRRDFLMEKGILFPQLPLMEDNLYLFRCILAAGRAKCISNRLYRRRIRKNSTMTSAQKEEKQYALGVTLCEITCRAADYREKEELYATMMEHARAMVRELSNLREGQSQEVWSGIAQGCEGIPLEEQLSLLLCLDDKHLQCMAQLREVRSEKAEIEDRLQVNYKEKLERGEKIRILRSRVKDLKQKNKDLKQKNKDLRQQTKDLKQQIKDLRQDVKGKKSELEELNSRFLVKVSQKFRRIFRRDKV